MNSTQKADHVLWGLYFGFMIPDILENLGFSSTREEQDCLHEFHKRILNCKTTKGMTQEEMSLFISRVCLFWAERGMFVRTKKGQPKKIQNLPLSMCWKWL